MPLSASRQIAEEKLCAVLERYAVGPLTAAPEPGGGTANANVTLQTASGRYFLKRRNPKYADERYVAFDHRLMEDMAPHGAGTPLAALTREGSSWLRMDGAVYELYPYQPGGSHDRHSLSELAAAGRALARFHRAVRSFN